VFDDEFTNRAAQTPSIRASDAPGLHVRDPIEQAAYDLQTPGEVSPTPVADPPFAMPVDTAVRVTTQRLTVPWAGESYAFRDGAVVAESQYGESGRFETGPLTVQIDSGPTVLYLHTPAGVHVSSGTDQIHYEFDDPVVTVGVRSYHEDPAGTVTTPDDPESLCRAVSHLGSALKTTGPERSFPTLRGHPPLLELGSTFSVTDGVDPPDTGVEIVVPADPASVFPVSTLAFYTGATVVPGDSPRLHAAGQSWSLTGDGRLAERLGVGDDGATAGTDSATRSFETVVAEVLQHLFVLDCVTRTYGYYPVETRECAAVESRTSVDFAALYDESLAERVRAFLSIPFDAVTPSRPVWRMTADLAPRAAHVELLPYTARNLATVRCPTADPATATDTASSAAVSSFFRAGRSPDDEGAGAPVDTDVVGGEVRLPETGAREHVWAGDGVAQNASLLTRTSFRRALRHDPKSAEPAVVAVVCNDPRMTAEGLSWVDTVAETDDRLDVRTHYELTVAELRDLFTAEADFLHYVGHVDGDGFRCTDGHFDARTLDRTGVESFLLNACRSYTQGRALIGRGSVGGLVTLSRVGNEAASQIGRLFVRLLGNGYTLAGATSIAHVVESSGRRYVGLGVQDFELVTNVGGHQLFNVVDSAGDGEYDLTIYTYPAPRNGLGTAGRAHVRPESERFLVPPGGEEFRATAPELLEYLELDTSPVLLDGDLHWSDEVDATML
jgi:hypothetical protein